MKLRTLNESDWDKRQKERDPFKGRSENAKIAYDWVRKGIVDRSNVPALDIIGHPMFKGVSGAKRYYYEDKWRTAFDYSTLNRAQIINIVLDALDWLTPTFFEEYNNEEIHNVFRAIVNGYRQGQYRQIYDAHVANFSRLYYNYNDIHGRNPYVNQMSDIIMLILNDIVTGTEANGGWGDTSNQWFSRALEKIRDIMGDEQWIIDRISRDLINQPSQ